MTWLPWKKAQPPQPSPETVQAANRLAFEVARVASQLERVQDRREDKPK